MPEPLLVTPSESGQKLLRFLGRRFNVPQGDLHRWIRTGQVRINGKRAKAFDRVDEGDLVRVPPFAGSPPDADVSPPSPVPFPAADALPPLVAETEELLIFNKPAGLPTHPGTGHVDSLATRLGGVYAKAAFRPTPAHRLDKDTSGLLLVAKSYAALRRLGDAFAGRGGRIVKEYLAWAAGDCPWAAPRLLEDRLAKAATNPSSGRERMRAAPSSVEGKEEREGKTARLTVRCVTRGGGASLLLIRLHTGRTHQIRAQLASRGFPLIGDVKYGGPPCRTGLKLHAARLTLESVTYEAPPPWRGVWSVRCLPPPLNSEV